MALREIKKKFGHSPAGKSWCILFVLKGMENETDEDCDHVVAIVKDVKDHGDEEECPLAKKGVVWTLLL